METAYEKRSVWHQYYILCSIGICIRYFRADASGRSFAGISIVAVQDEWLTRQTLQAFFLSLISGFVSVIIGAVSWSYRIPFLGTVLSGIFGIITALVTLVILILALIGLLNVIRGEDANVPFCRGLADKVFGPENKF